MDHKIAKLVLEHAGTFLERTEAIRTALSLGMPLNEIQAYLDWLDLIRRSPSFDAPGGAPPRGPRRRGFSSAEFVKAAIGLIVCGEPRRWSFQGSNREHFR